MRSTEVRLDGDQLIARRHVDADLALVWAAFTTPEHLAAFWGGNHAAIRHDSVAVELRVGGTFRLETVGADGCSCPLRFRYDVVEPPTLLVFTEPTTGLVTEVRLTRSGGGATVVIHQRRLPDDLRTEQARAGLAGILDRLDVVLVPLTAHQEGEHL